MTDMSDRITKSQHIAGIRAALRSKEIAWERAYGEATRLHLECQELRIALQEVIEND